MVLRGEFPLGFSFGGSVVAPGYGLRGVVLGFWAIRCPGFEDRTSIVAFSSVLVPLRVACLTDFLLEVGMSMYALRLGVRFLAKDTGNYAPVNFFCLLFGTKDLLSCLVIQLCKLRSNVSHG